MLEGKVALVTGAARGQGRSHAIRLAEEGADVIAVDVCAPISTVTAYAGATKADLERTVAEVEAAGGCALPIEVDVRDIETLSSRVASAVDQLNGLNIVVANAGVISFGAKTHEVSEESWNELMDINITGVWHTYKAAASHLLAAGAGGSLIIISSIAGFKGLANSAAYTTTKHALTGLVKVLANELGPYGIRVNAIHPNAIDTPMVKNAELYKLFRPDLVAPSEEDARDGFARMNPMGIPWIDPRHVSNAVVWLASDQSLYVSGGHIPVDAGAIVH